ncbi:MAG: hypothetical protein U0Q12_13195 [Vicinamibacterales bacterium]
MRHRLGRWARLTGAWGVLAIALASPATATAQIERQPRAYRGLFGRSTPTSGAYRFLDLSLGVNAGRDSHITFGRDVSSDPLVQGGGTFAGGSASLAFAQNSRRLLFSANLSGSGRRFQIDPPLQVAEYSAGVGFQWVASQHSRVTFNQALGVSPYFQLNLLPGLFTPAAGDLPPQRLDFAAVQQRTFSSYTSASYQQQLHPRTSLTFDGSRRGFLFLDARDALSTDVVELGGLLRHSLNRSLALRLGYRTLRVAYRNGGRTLTRDEIDAGFDYNHSFSFSRRATMQFNSGSTILRQGDGRTDFRLNGAAALNYQLGRTWTATALYSRNVGFAEGLDQLISYDAIIGQVRGFLNRRSQVLFGGGYSRGTPSAGVKAAYTTTTGEASYQLALSHAAALTAQYRYYFYAFDPDFQRTVTFDRTLNRHSIYGGVTWWVPLLR